MMERLIQTVLFVIGVAVLIIAIQARSTSDVISCSIGGASVLLVSLRMLIESSVISAHKEMEREKAAATPEEPKKQD